MALGQGKKTQQGAAKGYFTLGVAAAVTIYQGGVTILSGAAARAARAGQGVSDFLKIADASLSRVMGVALSTVTGGGADGAVTLSVEAGNWLAKNSAGVDAITAADIGRYCFVVDDETVARTSASGTRPRAGVVIEVDSTGVMVKMGPEIAAAAERTFPLSYIIPATELAAGTGIEMIAPRSGVIVRNSTIVQTAIVTGGDVTVQVNGVTVVGLTNTIADAAAKGSIVTDTPTAGDATTVVAAGDRITIIPAAAFNGGGAVNGTLEIAY